MNIFTKVPGLAQQTRYVERDVHRPGAHRVRPPPRAEVSGVGGL